LIEVFLEPREEVPYLFGSAQVGDCVRNCVVVLEFEQRRQLFAVEFLDALTHIMREDEVQEGLLLAIEVRADR
jgi:hypothetical protein